MMPKAQGPDTGDAADASGSAGLLAALFQMLTRQAWLWRVTAFVQVVLAFCHMITGAKLRCRCCTKNVGFALTAVGILLLAVAVYNILRDGSALIHCPAEMRHRADRARPCQENLPHLPPGTVRRLSRPRKWVLRLSLNLLACGPVALLPFLYTRRLRRFVLCNERQLSALEAGPWKAAGNIPQKN